MVSVTQRIKQIKQPRGGFLPVKAFTVRTLDDGQVLNPEESIAASLVGTAVDYLSRFMDGTAVEEAFEISLLGARAMRMEAKAFGLLDDIKELDDLSITKACQLAGFESGFRAGQPYIKHLDAEIWELRPLRNRILFVAWLDGSFVLLHHFVKKTQKTPRREIEKAKRELQDLKERGLRDEE